MNYTEYIHVEDIPPFSILKSPVGGYWLVSFTVDGCPVLKHSTRTYRAAKKLACLERQSLAILKEDSQHVAERQPRLPPRNGGQT